MGRWAVVAGIDAYTGNVPTLRNAARDAIGVRDSLLGVGYAADQVDLLLGETAAPMLTADVLLARIERALAAALADDEVLIYFAGHAFRGVDDVMGTQGYLLAQDAERSTRRGFLAMEALRVACRNSRARHLLLVLDCCFAGSFAQSSTRDLDAQPLYRRRYAGLQARRSFHLLASAAPEELAHDTDLARARVEGTAAHSPFAAAFLDALTLTAQSRMKADRDNDGIVTTVDLFAHVRHVLDGQATITHSEQTPGLWQLDWHNGGEMMFEAGPRQFATPRLPTLGDNPYRGLAPFRKVDAPAFRGREALSVKLTDHLAKHRCTVVVGPSGVGKSSLVCAGAFPRLEREGHALIGPIHLEQEPLRRLVGIAAQLPARVDRTEQTPAIVFIDQLEELVTTTVAPAERACVRDLLALIVRGSAEKAAAATAAAWRETAAAVAPDLLSTTEGALAALLAPHVHLVLGLRSDHEAHFTALLGDDKASRASWNQQRFVVPAMHREELRLCIEEPAARCNLTFDLAISGGRKPLVDTLLDEIDDMPGALPILSLVLGEMFRHHVQRATDAPDLGSDGVLAWEDYDAMGGTSGLLQRSADRVHEFPEATPPNRKALQASLCRVMLRLVTLDASEPARRRVHDLELRWHDVNENQRVDQVLRALFAARLITGDRRYSAAESGGSNDDRRYVEPAHDWLVKGWPQLREWIAAAPQTLAEHRDLSAAASLWASKGEHPQSSVLWPRKRLLPLLTALRVQSRPTVFLSIFRVTTTLSCINSHAFNLNEDGFVRASLQAARSDAIRSLGALALVLCLLTGLGLAYRSTQGAYEGELDVAAKAARTAEQMAQAREFLMQEQPQLASKVLVEVDRPDTVAGWSKLALEVLAKEIPQTTLHHSGQVVVVVWSPDGRRILSISDDRVARIWNADGTDDPVVFDGQFERGGWSAGGRYLALLDNDGVVHAWRERDAPGEVRARVTWATTNLKATCMAWSHAGDLLVVAFDDGSMQIWNASARDGEPATIATNVGTVSSIAWSPDDRGVVVVYKKSLYDLAAAVYNVEDGSALVAAKNLDIEIPVTTFMAWDRYAEWSLDGTLAVAPGNAPLVIMDLARGSVSSLGDDASFARWSPTSNDLLLSDRAGTRIVSRDGEPRWTIAVDSDRSIVASRWSPDGTRVATVSGATVRILRADKRDEPRHLNGHTEPIRTLAWSPDGRRVVTGSADHSLKIWIVERAEVFTPYGNADAVQSIWWSPDSRFIAAVTLDHKGWILNTADVTERIHVRGMFSDQIRSFSWSPDGERLAAVTQDSWVPVWTVDHPHGRFFRSTKGLGTTYEALDWSPDSSRIVTADSDGIARVWSADGSGEVVALQGSKGDVSSIAWSPDGAHIVVVLDEGSARVWDMQDLTINSTEFSHGLQKARARWSSDSRRVELTSGNDERIWDLESGLASVKSGSFTRESQDVGAWRKVTGKPLEMLQETEIQISPDGERVGTIRIDGTVRVWPMSVNAIQEALRGANNDCLTDEQRERFLRGTESAYTFSICESRLGRTPHGSSMPGEIMPWKQARSLYP